MDLLQLWNEYIRREGLFRDTDPVLVAVSGGVDSVVLAHLFYLSGRPFGIAHAHFGLRGQESDGDELFVRDLGKNHAVKTHVAHFSTLEYAEKNGLSVQMAARRLRYEWFEKLRENEGYAAVATAHHLNDDVETLLWNLVRGTGIDGLTGMAPRRGALVRSLLWASKAQLEQHALAHGLTWREDRSNNETAYKRNYLRHHVVPHLEELNPAFLHTAARTLERLRQTAENYRFLIKKEIEKGLQREGDTVRAPKALFRQFPGHAQALGEWLKPFGFSEEQIRQMADSETDQTGKEWATGEGFRLVSDRTDWLLAGNPPPAETLTIQPDDLMATLPDGSRIFLLPTVFTPTTFPDGKNEVMVPSGKLRFPLLVRSWREGDVFQPFGMGGKKQKLQDYFTNAKLSALEKEAVWLLVNGDGVIIWVIGYRADERFRTEAGEVGMKIRWEKRD